MPKQPDNKNQSTRHHNRRSPEPGQNHALTLNGRIMVLLLVIGFIAVGCGVLIYKLYTLQIRDAEQYRVQAAEQQLSDTQIPATRGSIYSANGKLLAKSSVVWNIIANPSKCNQDYVAEASQKISELLNGSVSAEKIQEQLSKTNSQYRVIAKGIDMVTAQSIIDYANTKRITNGKAEGDPDAKYETVLSMYKESSSTREYPNGMYLSSVLGFCDDSGNGMYGLEKSYDEKLVGTPGRSISSENAWGYELANEESDTHAAINGYNLNLTIDDTIQTVLETELSNAIDDYDVQNRASAIVMNVNTGAVLGMATAPQFDPNDPYNITEPKLQAILDNAGTALTEDDISVLQSRLGQDAVADIIADGVVNPNGTKSTDEEGNKIDVPSEKSQLQGMIREAEWKNKAVTELYYPGSVFKLMTAAAALDSGLMGADQQFYCGGDLTVFPNTEWEHSYRCAEGNTHGWLDMAGALNHSCNLYFIQVAEKMSAEFFYNYYQAFGLTQTTGIDLPYEAKGISKTQQEMEQVETDLYSTAFGQSQKLTLIQMAAAVASTVNGGYLMTPYAVARHISAGTTVIVQVIAGTGVTHVVFHHGADLLTDFLADDLALYVGFSLPYHVAGVVRHIIHHIGGHQVAAVHGGSHGGCHLDQSQLLDWKGAYKYRPDGDYRKAISFAAILPADDPEILVLVMMDDPRWIFDYASQIVAPVTGNIISQIAPYLGIERDASYDSNGSVEVPNAIGTRWTSAQVKMNAAGLSHRFVDTSDGDVVYQYPAGGTVVPAGSTVYLYTQSTTDATTTVPDATGKTGTFAAQMLKVSGVNVAISGSASDRVVRQDIEVGSVVPYGTVVTLTTEPDGSSDAQQDADTPQDDAAQDDTPQDAAGENDQDSTTQDDTGSDAEQQ